MSHRSLKRIKKWLIIFKMGLKQKLYHLNVYFLTRFNRVTLSVIPHLTLFNLER